LRIAVALDPNSSLAHHYLGTALYNAEDYAAAATEFRRSLQLQPNASNHYFLAACLIGLNNYDEALAELEVAAKLEPQQDLYRTRKQELLKLIRVRSPR
jgi:tetratricopeptide (TPR) repeat protein